MATRVDEFLIDVKPQREWGWLVITYLFLGGAGAGLFLTAVYIEHDWAAGLGLLVLLVGVLMLFLDLGRPERFWRAFFRPQSSWISRGCFFITLLVIFGTLDLAARLSGLHVLQGSGTMLGTSLRAMAALTAVLVMIYTGFLLSASTAIPFWNSAFFPIIFFAYSLLAGIDILLLASPLLPGPAPDLLSLWRIQHLLTVVCLLLLASHFTIMSGAGVAARESIRLLTRGRWAGLFLGGVVGAGLVLPLVFAWPAAWRSGAHAGLILTIVLPLLRLFGDYLFRFLVIRAGLYDPLL